MGAWDLDLGDHSARRSPQHDLIFGYEEPLPRWTYEMFLEHVVPEDRAEVDRAFRRTVEARSDWSFECRIRRRDGEIRWIWAAGRHLVGEPGRPGRMAGIVQDITERRAVEEELRRSERVYRAIGESIDFGVWICAPDGRNTYASESFLRLVGLTQQQCSEFGWGDVLHPDDAERTVAAWKECVRTGAAWDVEHRYRGVDGAWHPILARGVPVKDDDGKILCWAGINLDISQLKAAEQAARVGEERLRALADSMPQLAWTAEADGTVTWCNRRWYEYTGTAPEQLQDGSWDAIHDPAAMPEVRRRWRASVESGEAFEMEFPLRGVDGVFRRFLTRAVPLKDERGHVLKWFGTNTDVTELVAAQEALREADRRKNEFLSVLSHELRNPLAPIRNSVALLRRAEPGTEPARRAIDVIDRQAEQLARLVDDLLDLSRITQGKIRLERRVVRMAEVVRQAVQDHEQLLARKEIVLEYRDRVAPMWVEADPARLAQVVGNLLQNAAKFTQPGGRVEVTLGTEAGQAVLRIRDDGAGMDPATLARLFQPFMQARATLDRTQGGLGLGLALAKDLVQMHGGTIRAASPGPGRGSELTVSLPLADAPGATPTPTPAPQPDRRGVRRVVVIEDNLDGATSLRELLELEGHQVVVAHDGQQGLDAVLAEGPDVVLCDIGLPTLDGYEIARRLRAAGCRARLVALTGYAAPDDVERARQAGFDDHLPKPPDLGRLYATVGAVG